MQKMLSNTEADEIGEEYARLIYNLHPNNSLCVDIEGLATEVLGLSIIYESFAGKDEMKLGYLADGSDAVCILKNGAMKSIVYPWKTMVLSRSLLSVSESGRKRFTIAHEAAHFILEKLMIADIRACAHHEFDPEHIYRPDEFRDGFGFPEYCADKLGAALLMPRFNIERAIERFAEGRNFTVYGNNIIPTEDKIRMQYMADGIGVSFQALKIRLKELGYLERHSFDEFVRQDLQDGDFDDSDIEYDRNQGRLTPNQAYLIHRSRRESARLEQRKVNCPVCRLPMMTVSADSSGYPNLKCQKCKLTSPLGLSYFRTGKHTASPDKPVRCAPKKKNIR